MLFVPNNWGAIPSNPKVEYDRASISKHVRLCSQNLYHIYKSTNILP